MLQINYIRSNPIQSQNKIKSNLKCSMEAGLNCFDQGPFFKIKAIWSDSIHSVGRVSSVAASSALVASFRSPCSNGRNSPVGENGDNKPIRNNGDTIPVGDNSPDEPEG